MLPSSTQKPQDTSNECPAAIRTLVINLDRRSDRWDAVRARLEPLERAGYLRCERFRATDGACDEVPDEIIGREWTTDRNAMYDKRVGARAGVKLQMSSGERGCAMSHVRAWQLVAACDSEQDKIGSAAGKSDVQTPVLILEDDTVLANDFEKRLRAMLATLPPDSGVDILYLGYIKGEAAPWRRKVVEEIYEAEYLWTTVAYLLWPQGARHLLSTLPVDEPIDNFMAWQMATRRICGFAIHPPLAEQAGAWDAKSDVTHSDDAMIAGSCCQIL